MSDPQSTQDATENIRSKLEHIVETKAYVDDLEMVPWYTKELEDPKPTVRDLFETYSKVPPADVVAHIKHVRDKAFKIVYAHLTTVYKRVTMPTIRLVSLPLLG